MPAIANHSVHPPQPSPPRRLGARGAGLSMIEVVIATAVVGVMYASALNTLSAARASELIAAEQRQGQELAQDMMAEILALPYVDPTNASEFGPGAGESSTSNRLSLDDIDDYFGFFESTIRRRDGSIIGAPAGWTRTSFVFWVQVDNPMIVRSSETGLKAVLVVVQKGTKTLGFSMALRSRD